MPSPDEIVIEARHLRKVFGATVAVDALDLAIGRGETYGLVGPDGAGKTTTLRLLCGALPATAGSAMILGFNVASQIDEVQQRIGYVSQQFSLYPELTVDENLSFRARAYGISETDFKHRREQLLAFTRLGRFRRRQARALSGGMKQKLSLAAALLHEPEVVLLDEPTTGVDPVSRGEFWQMLLSLAEQGTTFLVTTTYMDEAERCRRVGLLYEGRLLVEDTPHEVRRLAGITMLEVRCAPLVTGRKIAGSVQGVQWAELFGDRLHLAVEEADIATSLERTLQNAEIQVSSIRQIQPGLEDAFFEFVRRSREALP